MTRRKFDRFMVAVELSANPKIGRLTDAEFRCLVGGVWPLAAKANPRGFLLVGALPAEPSDIAHQARCTTAVAARTMAKLRELGMLEADEPTGWEWVHDWDELNPDPKPSDQPDATRDRKRKSRAGHADVTRDAGTSHADVTSESPRARALPEVEVEGEEETPPQPPASGGRKRAVDSFERTAAAWAAGVGVSGDDARLVKAYRQAAPWTDPEPAAYFRGFCRQHFQSLTIEEAPMPNVHPLPERAA